MTNTGLNSFDILYYINLDRRPQRNASIVSQLKKSNIESSKINRLSACDLPNFGALGCTKSHIDILTRFLNTDDSIQTCIVMEDDFGFIMEQSKITELVDQFLIDFKDNWDVLLLSLNMIYGEKTEHPYAVRVYRSFTTAGYVVTKTFAKTLLDNFKESAALIEKEDKYIPELCLDNFMGKLQTSSKWYAICPRVGLQLPSYSDIERRFVDYRC